MEHLGRFVLGHVFAGSLLSSRVDLYRYQYPEVDSRYFVRAESRTLDSILLHHRMHKLVHTCSGEHMLKVERIVEMGLVHERQDKAGIGRMVLKQRTAEMVRMHWPKRTVGMAADHTLERMVAVVCKCKLDSASELHDTVGTERVGNLQRVHEVKVVHEPHGDCKAEDGPGFGGSMLR